MKKKEEKEKSAEDLADFYRKWVGLDHRLNFFLTGRINRAVRRIAWHLVNGWLEPSKLWSKSLILPIKK